MQDFELYIYNASGVHRNEVKKKVKIGSCAQVYATFHKYLRCTLLFILIPFSFVFTTQLFFVHVVVAVFFFFLLSTLSNLFVVCAVCVDAEWRNIPIFYGK